MRIDPPKKTDAELLALTKDGPKWNTKWIHYKTGKLYFVDSCAINESTQEVVVVYTPQYSSVYFVRPLSEWEEEVVWEGRVVKRFTPLRNEE